MRRFVAWLACAVGVAWLLRRLRRKSPAPAEDPAEELRRKLAETRPSEQQPEPEQAPTPTPEAPLDERRRAVHDRARAAIDDMRGPGPDPE